MDNKTDEQNEIEKVAELEKKLNEMEESWKRALADYKNLEKRTHEEKAVFAQYANGSLLQKFISILDLLEKVSGYLKDEGLEMIIKEFKQILTNEGIKEIEALGKDFDPTIMDAIDITDGEKNKVIEVVVKGYYHNGKLLRPAGVKVGNGNSSIN